MESNCSINFMDQKCRSTDNIFFLTTIILCILIVCLCISCVCTNCCCCYCFLRRESFNNRPRTCKIYKNIHCVRGNLIKTQTTQTEHARYPTVNNNRHSNRFSSVNNNNNNSENGFLIYDYIERNGLFSLPPSNFHEYESIN